VSQEVASVGRNNDFCGYHFGVQMALDCYCAKLAAFFVVDVYSSGSVQFSAGLDFRAVGDWKQTQRLRKFHTLTIMGQYLSCIYFA